MYIVIGQKHVLTIIHWTAILPGRRPTSSRRKPLLVARPNCTLLKGLNLLLGYNAETLNSKGSCATKRPQVTVMEVHIKMS